VITAEEQQKAMEFHNEVWRRWAAKEISTDQACAELEKYLHERLPTTSNSEPTK
jgi:hypothetical protein